MRRTTRLRHARALRRGFTLVEMSIITIIVGILAVLAVVGYRKQIVSSRIAEATGMVGAIRTGQESYKAEIGNFANISASVTSFYPSNVAPNTKVAWGGACTNCAAADASGPNTVAVDWKSIGVHPDAPVFFGYMTRAHSSTKPDSYLPGGTITHKGLDMKAEWQKGWVNNPGAPWYVIRAVTDLANPTTCLQVVSSSFDSAIHFDDTLAP